MKSFAIIAAFAGAAAAQSLGSCAQSCITSMADIAQKQFGCSAGDTKCYCSKIDYSNGVRDCSQQACSATENAQAVAFAATQCGSAQASGPAVSILSSAAASASAAASVAASGAASAALNGQTPIATIPLLATTTNSAGQTITTTTGFSTVFSSLTGSAAAAASSAAAAASSARGSASGVAASASGAVASAASSAAAAASSAADAATGSKGAAMPLATAMPVVAGLGAFAALFL